jgi:hypothetical protein
MLPQRCRQLAVLDEIQFLGDEKNLHGLVLLLHVIINKTT